VPLLVDLLRHGDALPAGKDGDDARTLSPRGARDLERLASHLAQIGWRPERVYTSPLVRARESARIALGLVTPSPEVEVLEALRPSGEPGAIVRALSEEGSARHVLMVGHQPLLGELAALLTHRPGPGFTPACLVRIEFTEVPAAGGGTLRWRIQAEDCE